MLCSATLPSHLKPKGCRLATAPDRVQCALRTRGCPICCRTHTLDTFDLGQDVYSGIVEQKVLVDVLVFAVDIHVHQHAGHVLQNDDASRSTIGGRRLLTMLMRFVDVQHRHIGVGPRLKHNLNSGFACTGGDEVMYRMS